jgi:DnaJ-like protein
MDPFTALELPPGATAEEIAAAYRRLAKRWHPDRGGGTAAAARMAEINVAYDVLRAGAWQRPDASGSQEPAVTRVAATRGLAGGWLAEPLRRALGRELLVALDAGEAVALVTPAATWASPRTLLAVTDRRLLWLLDDAPTHRVRSLPYTAIAEIDHRLRRPRRKVAVLRVRTKNERTHSFSELRPETAAAIVGHVAAARVAALEAAS